MSATTHVSKWGSSLAVRIPKAIAEEWGVQEGSAIEIVARDECIVLSRKPYDLAEMLARVTPENLHSEQDTGPARGREDW